MKKPVLASIFIIFVFAAVMLYAIFVLDIGREEQPTRRPRNDLPMSTPQVSPSVIITPNMSPSATVSPSPTASASTTAGEIQLENTAVNR